MAKTKPKSTQAQLSREDKLKILKRAKLYDGSVKIAKGKASGAQKRALAQFKNDIPLLASGKAKAISVGKARKKDFAKDMQPRKGRVVVRVEEGEKPRYNKKSRTITSTVESHGVKYKRRIMVGGVKSVAELPRGKRLRYMVPFAQWGIADSPLFSDPEELARFMQPYADKGWTDWLDLIEVLELAPRQSADDEELEDV